MVGMELTGDEPRASTGMTLLQRWGHVSFAGLRTKPAGDLVPNSHGGKHAMTSDVSFMFQVPDGAGSAPDLGFETITATLLGPPPSNAFEYSGLLAAAEVLRRGEALDGSAEATLPSEITIDAEDLAKLFRSTTPMAMGSWVTHPPVDRPLVMTIETGPDKRPAKIQIRCDGYAGLTATVTRSSARHYSVQFAPS
jgi:hypothetical protein